MVYANSYERIMDARGRTALTFERFNKHLAALRGKKHGSIICASRPGWVRFTENLVRGYVRLKAESCGVRLALEHEPSPDPKLMWKKSPNKGIAPGYSHPKYNFGRF